jgi:S1-C subfamily serine protease
VLQVHLGDRWHGTTEDLRQLTQLKQQRYFRLIGAPVNDDVAKMFGEKEKLSVLQLMDTKVTPAAVDAIKEKHPDAIVYVRNQALLGVSAENHAAGVRVMFVQPGSAADRAGFKPGDVIASIDGKKLPDFDRLTAQIAQHQPGDKINVEVVRNDKPDTMQVVLGSRNGQNE